MSFVFINRCFDSVRCIENVTLLNSNFSRWCYCILFRHNISNYIFRLYCPSNYYSVFNKLRTVFRRIRHLDNLDVYIGIETFIRVAYRNRVALVLQLAILFELFKTLNDCTKNRLLLLAFLLSNPSDLQLSEAVADNYCTNTLIWSNEFHLPSM